MRLALARALFVKVDMSTNYQFQANHYIYSPLYYFSMNLQIIVRFPFQGCTNKTLNYVLSVDLNALAWLEDYLQTWPGTLLVVYVLAFWASCRCWSSIPQFPRSCIPVRWCYFCNFHSLIITRDAVATDIVHQHSGRLDYYKGSVKCVSPHCDYRWRSLWRNFTQFYSTKSERDRNLRKEYDTQMDYRKHLQAFIDRWRYNANRGRLLYPLSPSSIMWRVIYSI